MLIWLVAPVEATTDGAAVLGGAAVAAAGVGTTVNYWAAMEDETAGDTSVLTKRKGS